MEDTYVRKPKRKKGFYLMHIDDELRRRIRYACFRRDIKMAVFIREAIDAHCLRYEKLLQH